MQIELVTVLHGGAVHLRDKPARARQLRAVKADAIADGYEVLRRLARVPGAAAANMQAKFAGKRREAPLEGTEDARGDAGRVPVHSHHRTKGLEPERIGQPPQELVAAVVVNDRLADH